ncbi:MAG TPA: hypothetical protein VFU22_21005 [Roseiflexaceae bacterium]|nr:hypothetical protein [Roseiflexaceae bacterium]
MRLDILIDQLLDSIARERLLLRRAARYLLPLLLLPIGFALAQMTRSWLGALAGGVGGMVLLAQIELLIRPLLDRTRTTDRDISLYLQIEPVAERPNPASAAPLLWPSALAVAGSMALFLPTILSAATTWQRLLALALGIGALLMVWQRLVTAAALLDQVEQRLLEADRAGGRVRERAIAKSPRRLVSLSPGLPVPDGLLDPALSRRVAGLPMPLLALSPAAQALLHIEAYLLLRDLPDIAERDLREALAALARQAYDDEQRHMLLPPVGGKIYLPVVANGALARMLGATARRLGMDGGYSASLGTWLLRLPPAHSYAVAGRLIDALITLGLPPRESILPHHLTVQGELGQASKLLSLLHLASTPLLFAERPGHAQGDDRPFIMRGGGVLDDMAGRGRHSGPRTDFVDGFIFVQAPGLDGVEHLTAHTINLRVKQVLAFGLLANARPYDRRSPAERDAAIAYTRLRDDLRTLLDRHDVAAALDIPWLDGRWSEVWPLILRISELKERDPGFLDAAQQLRDSGLDQLEQIATSVTRQPHRQ